MSLDLPADAPKTTNEAFAFIGRMGGDAGTTVDDLKILALTEALGKELYARIAKSFDDPEALALFRLNGKEELAHGRRLMAAAELLDS